MERYISESLVARLIHTSCSPVGAGFFFVKKKDGMLHPCIDFRGLNEITVRNKYPLSPLDAAFAPLQRVRFFTKLDLRNAYHLIHIRQRDEWKTVFIFLETEKEHVQHVQLVLRCLLENCLFGKAEKFEFHASSVSFLGFIVKQGQLSPDPAKVQAMVEWLTPSTRKQLLQFLGFANFYCRFSLDYSRVAAPRRG